MKKTEIEKRFQEQQIQKFMNSGLSRKNAELELDIIKKDYPQEYKEMLDNFFDEVHPY